MTTENSRLGCLHAAEKENVKNSTSFPTGVVYSSAIMPKTTTKTTIRKYIRLVCMVAYLGFFLLLFLSPKIVSGENLSKDEDDIWQTEKLTKVLGGTTISSRVPYFVWLKNCGATMIHHDIGLTAAHCSIGENALIGIRTRHDPGGGRTRIQSVSRHPLYDDDTFDFDFAVIKFAGWFPQSTVQLNRSTSTPTTGDRLTILGFGGSETLKQGSVSYVHPSTCSMAWGEFGYEIREDIVLCAADSSGADACTGDSGGPLMDGSVQVGVISSGSGCNGLLPTTYSRVSGAIDWIETQICDMSAFPPGYCPGISTFNGTIVRVDIKLDEYPEDIMWSIHRDSALGPVMVSGDGYSVENTLESKFVPLEDGDYVFVIEDQSGFADGLGASGSYKVVEVNSQGNDARTLANGGGGFGELESTIFTVGVPETSSPTVANTTAPTSMLTAAPSVNVTSAATTVPEDSPQPSLRPVAPSVSPVTASPPTVEETDPSDDESPTPSEAIYVETPVPMRSPVSPTKSPTNAPTTLLEKESLTESPTKLENIDRPSSNPTASRVGSSEVDEEEEERPPQAAEMELAKYDIHEGNRRLQTGTSDPTESPTVTQSAPTTSPTEGPTEIPEVDETTVAPTASTTFPSRQPTLAPTSSPTRRPTSAPTPSPTEAETLEPSEETQEPTDSPSDEPTEETDAPSISIAPSTFPSVSVMPSTVPSISSMPSDIPTLFQVSTTDAPSAIPTALPTTDTPSFPPTSSETDAPSVAPSASIEPTERSSSAPSSSSAPTVQVTASPTTSAAPSTSPTQAPTTSQQPTETPESPSTSPTSESVEPTQSTNITDVPTAPNGTVVPSQTPTLVASDVTSASPSEAPTVPLQRYLIAVSLLIESEPQEIEWGFYEFESNEKAFGYPLGWYDREGFTVSTVILKSGTWEFILGRGTDTATAIVEFGILNQETGGVEEIATVNLGTATDSEARAVFSLD
jgi:hypothetical protein